jgi:hypothetical protein
MPYNTILTPVCSARNIVFTFDPNNLTLNDQIASLTESCFYHSSDLRRLKKSQNLNTSRLVAISPINSKLDYCNSLYLNLPSAQINSIRSQQQAQYRTLGNSNTQFQHLNHSAGSKFGKEVNIR